MKPMQTWYNDSIEAFDEVTEKFYYNQLEIIRPILMFGPAFLVGEVHHHNDNGEAMYSSFTVYMGKYYWLGYNTRKHFESLYGNNTKRLTTCGVFITK